MDIRDTSRKIQHSIDYSFCLLCLSKIYQFLWHKNCLYAAISLPSGKMNLTRKTATPEPNRQFILDLQSWIQDLHENGHQVILNLDNNEDLYASDGRVQPIPYCPDDVASCTAHDGSLATLVVSCGLIDILGLQHSSRPFPPTYIRGHKRIDYLELPLRLQSSLPIDHLWFHLLH